MIDITIMTDPKRLIEAMARLKNIPVSKVVRNASRDFAQAAQKETPIATKSKSEYYKYFKNGVPHFLHESQVAGRKRKTGLRKVRIYKGWSKASWLGVFRALGVSLKVSVQRLPSKVEHISHAVTRGSVTESTTTITDYIHFDEFGRGNDERTETIGRRGFELAAKRMSKEVNRMLLKQWSGQ
jgi:hypothetical protein